MKSPGLTPNVPPSFSSFPEQFPKSYDAMTDAQLAVWLKQVARVSKTKDAIEIELKKSGYTEAIAIDETQNHTFVIRIKGHQEPWIQS